MHRFLVRRFLGAAVTLLIISAVTFCLFFAVPRDPARFICGKVCPPETLALVRHNLGLDEPLFLQYWHWLRGIAAGRDLPYGRCEAPCLGFSFVNQEPVLDAIVARLPVTVSLALGAAAFFLIFGVGAGMIAAARRGRATDTIARVASLIGGSLQIYFVGVLATWVLVDRLRLLERPVYHPFTENPVRWFTGLLLPCLVLALAFTANYTRTTRAALIDQLGRDYIRTAHAMGMHPRAVFLRYAGRGALAPVVTLLGVDLGALLGGAVITERTFGLHGIGELSIRAVVDQDLPMLLGVVLVATAAVVVCNAVVDVGYAVIDPRVRLT